MKNNKGFTLLVAILITSVFLIVSFVVINVAVKQLLLANSAQESQYAFYAADSGTECAVYWDLKNTVSAFDPNTPGTITCNNQTISTGSQTVPTIPSQPSLIGGGGGNTTSIFSLNLTKGCAIVRVTKAPSGVTTVDSRGYNTCSNTAGRRFERGLTLAFNTPIPFWSNPVNVTVSGNSLNKSSGIDGVWDAGAVSLQTVSSGNVYAEFTTGEIGTHKMAGLSNSNPDQSYTSIKYAFYMQGEIGGRTLYIFESGLNSGWPQGSYQPGDILRIAIESGQVKYYQNGVLLYSHPITVTYPYLLDTSLYSSGATINNASIVSY